MEYRPLGRSGVLVSSLCLGVMNFGMPTDEDESHRMVAAALDAGVNFVDVANVYAGGESERILGRAIAALGARDRVFVATKCGMPTGAGPLDRGFSRHHVIKACEDSLRRLGMDHIDLYQLHRPPPPGVPQEEVLWAFDDLVRAGKVRHVGASTHPAWMVMEAIAIAERLHLTPYVSEQPPYNLLDRRIEVELVPLCRKHNLAILPWSPLGGGILAGRYDSADDVPADSRAARREFNRSRLVPGALEVAAAVGELAREAGLTAGQLSLLWVRDQPGITSPIIGPRTMAQLEESLAIPDQGLEDDLRARLDELVPPGGAVTDFHNTSGWRPALATGASGS